MKKIIIIAGARPNFVKAAPLMRAFRALPRAQRPDVKLVHTGQHYDYLLSRIFFQDLEIPKPDIYLKAGSGTHVEQISRIMQRFEPVLTREKPDLVVVVGDVNSTLACALAASKCGVAVAHVEAGLRSFDQSMPEEANRVLTDHLSILLFTHCKIADKNLADEGISSDKVHLAGNVMIDSLASALPQAAIRPVLERLKVEPRDFALATLHRPSNVDEPGRLRGFLGALAAVSRDMAVVFPAHPRTMGIIEKNGLLRRITNAAVYEEPERAAPKRELALIPPLGYLDFLRLESNAACVITDSGGIQEETSYLGVPCLTARDNTERPVTVNLGTNRVIGGRPEALLPAWRRLRRSGFARKRVKIPGWDGRAAERIVKLITDRPQPPVPFPPFDC